MCIKFIGTYTRYAGLKNVVSEQKSFISKGVTVYKWYNDWFHQLPFNHSRCVEYVYIT